VQLLASMMVNSVESPVTAIDVVKTVLDEDGSTVRRAGRKRRKRCDRLAKWESPWEGLLSSVSLSAGFAFPAFHSVRT
jgi:hypothetical protein